MKVGIYAPSLTMPYLTGIGNYSFNLVKNLPLVFPNHHFYIISKKPLIHNPLPSTNVILEENPVLAKLPNSIWFRYFSFRYINKANFDILLLLEPFTPKFTRTRKVLFVYDLVLFVYPESMQLKTFLNYKLFFKKSISEADFLVSISRGTARRLKDILGKDVDAVVRPGVNITPYNPEPIFRFDYILSVSTIEPRKNIHSLIEAFVSLKNEKKLKGTKLVLVGKYGWKSEKIVKLLQDYREDIIHTGYVSREELFNLYSNAKVFVLPSVYEGFGIPVLEARMSGCCVITTDIPEIREACGEGCLYIKPTVDEIKSALDRFFSGNLNCDYSKPYRIDWQTELENLKHIL